MDSDGNVIQFDYDPTHYDESNPLVLPGQRSKTSVDHAHKNRKHEEILQRKVLSKRKRKQLERKVAQKEKKMTRAELWKELEHLAEPNNRADVSVLPLFNRSKKQDKKKTNSENAPQRGKSWKLEQKRDSDDSKDTDDYSSDESSHPTSPVSEEPVPPPPKTEVTPVEAHTEIPQPPPTVTPKNNTPARFVLVSRSSDIITARLALPIIGDEATIMESISEHDCVIICGATGCGKTTQVPQFLYEGGYTKDGLMIGVTEPRRVAAISMSQRVGVELNLSSKRVSYHIRYEKTTAKKTEIKFMTDGVLLQEIKQDFELSRYSAIIIDEAHERSIFTDVLLGLISMVLRLRRRRFTENKPTRGVVLPPLKLIIMSATLKVDDFSSNPRLFPQQISGPPPVIHVESRQFPVTCHFAKITQPDYLKAAFRKVMHIHQTSPPGGILVFLTGQREVLTLCSWLSRAFPKLTNKERTSIGSEDEPLKKRTRRSQKDSISEEKDAPVIAPDETGCEVDITPEEHKMTRINLDNFDIIPADEEIELDSIHPVSSLKPKVDKDNITVNCQSDTDLEEVDEDDDILEEIANSETQAAVAPIHALPLYSLLPPEKQQLVFSAPPEGHRLVVVATNVAETSLTIPNIRYVVDSGKVKTKVYDPATGASRFEVVWVSQASAEQRAGRAGRVAPGHCYRLYSSQVFSEMKLFATPDILTRPIDEVVLMLKSYLGSTPLSKFPLPTPPDSQAVDAAERRLMALGALEERSGRTGDPIRIITRAGRWMAHLPLPARFARMLLFANQHQLMPYAVVLVAALSVTDLYLPVQSTGSQKPSSETVSSTTDVFEAPLEQFRTNFVQQFVRRHGDLYFGDLAVLLGTVCCLERYAAQLNGLATPEPEIVDFCGGQKQIARDPDGCLRLLVERCGVRWNAYKEIRQLRQQLTEILNANVPDLNLALDPVLARPTPDQVQQLRQLFLVGSPCHVASIFDVPVEGLPAKERRRLRHAYRVPGIRGPVFIEAGSPLSKEDCPFVAFLELHTTSKPFLRTVCAIDPKWIPFLAPQNYKVNGLTLTDEQKTSDSLASEDKASNECPEENSERATKKKSDALRVIASPRYDQYYDTIVTGSKSISYIGIGAVDLDVDSGEIELPTSILVPINSLASARSIGAKEAATWSVRWFARCLLEGSVFPELVEWFPHRIKKSASPSLLTVSWGIVRPEVRKLVSPLLTDGVDSRRLLMLKWRNNSLYLSDELAGWIQPEFINQFHTSWPLISPTDVSSVT
ncbi:unnamed protein product [Calicophoron daubneyi]|uniref:RNA helicase n=1 Tax=Calicophoron daubneyi TaxID=300641 RepID=A0AAV2TC80_CALDB